jgi:hypothetical protein
MTCACSYRAGDRVKVVMGVMGSRTVYGTVRDWPEERCHFVQWDGAGGSTGLPNLNVERVDHDTFYDGVLTWDICRVSEIQA